MVLSKSNIADFCYNPNVDFIVCTPTSMTTLLYMLFSILLQLGAGSEDSPSGFLHGGLLKHWDYLTAILLFTKSTNNE